MIFWAIVLAGVTALVFAAVMLLHPTLYVSAICLLVVLLQTGLIFLLRGAALLGLLQVMIYAGAVMVLAVITIMAAGGGRDPERFADFSFPRWLAAFGLAAAAAEVALTVGSAAGGGALPSQPGPALSEGFARALFSSYALATEAVTLLMFLAALAIAPEPEGA